MKLKINLEQEMTEEELDVLYEEFDIDGENKAAQLCFLLKSVLVAQLNEALAKAQEWENESKKKAEEKILGEKK
jgi:hypothetical protein